MTANPDASINSTQALVRLLEAALAAAVAADEPCFIDVVSRPIGERIPPVYSWLKESGIDPFSQDPY
jgi:hypothetical protein